MTQTGARRPRADARRNRERLLEAARGNPYEHSRERLLAAITELLSAGARDGSLRADVGAADVLAGLGGLTLAAGEPAQRAQAGRLLDLLMDGLRHRPG